MSIGYVNQIIKTMKNNIFYTPLILILLFLTLTAPLLIIIHADEHQLKKEQIQSPIWALEFSPDGKSLAVGKYQWVELWDIETKEMVHVYEPHLGRVRCLEFSSDGKTLYASGGQAARNGEIRVWNVDTEELINTYEIHADTIESISISPDNAKLLTASMDEFSAIIDLVNLDDTKPLDDQAKWLTQHVGRVLCTLYHPNGDYFVTGSEDKTLKVWNPEDNTVLVSFDGNDDSVYSLAYASQENLIVSGSADNVVRSWRITQNNGNTRGTLARNFSAHQGPVYSVDCGLLNDQQIIASGSADTSVIIWDILSGNRRRTFNQPTDAVYAVKISPDGTHVAAGSRDGMVRIWDIENNQLTHEF